MQWRRRTGDGLRETGADRWAGMGLQGLAHRFFSKDWYGSRPSSSECESQQRVQRPQGETVLGTFEDT